MATDIMDAIDATINKDSPVPLYYQLKQFLWEIIKRSRVGDPIPPESEICDRFGISRPTVRQAVSALVTEGYLERKKGRGTFVTEPKIRRDFLLVMESFNKEMTERGIKPTTKMINLSEDYPDEVVAEKLMSGVSEKVFYLRRLRLVQSKPLFVVNSYIPVAKAPGLRNYDLEANSLHAILQVEYGYKFERAVRTIEIQLAEPAEAELLEVEVGSPIHYVETVIYTSDNHPLKYARTWYRGDRSRFSYELSRHDIESDGSHDIRAALNGR